MKKFLAKLFNKKIDVNNLSNKGEEYKDRLNKLNDISKKEIVYKDRYDKPDWFSDIKKLDRKNFRDGSVVLESPKTEISSAGRIISIRNHGGLAFCVLQDMTDKIQLAFSLKALNIENMNFLKEYIDLGDFIGFKGEAFITKRDTLAVAVNEFKILSKSLRPFPSEYFGIEDPELKYRKRYLDMILNETTRNRFIIREKVVQSLRNWLLEKRFREVVTRTIQPIAGGAVAKTFKTHHNALNHDFNLRISNELDLKLAVCAGIERVFEFAIDFRNEGIDPSHLQEFQMLEWYLSYENYITGMDYCEDLIKYTLRNSIGGLSFELEDRENKKHTISFDEKIPRITFKELLNKYGIRIDASFDELLKHAEELNLDIKEAKKRSRGNLLDDIYKKKIRPNLIKPVFVTNYPVDLVPLARINDIDKTVSDSYQLVIGSWEIVKGYSELVNPIQQEDAFIQQAKAKKDGDEEAMNYNSEFLTAMEHGMPPITGFGMGIDRFVSLITGAKNIKDTVLFPLLLPDNKN